MADFDRSRNDRRDSSGGSRGRSRNFEGGSGRRDSSDGSRGRSKNFDGSRRDSSDGPRGRSNNFEGSRRDSGDRKRFSKNRRDNVEMTKVTCDSCGVKCEVPFKPTSSKPIYCSDCFRKSSDTNGSGRNSGKDFELINEKLDKIMAALDIQ
ncbi:hypothetical protein HQ545_01540 [Candidatus Woesearchaeota archaeon]|nr:hypothetical protein [Candidatus Woesearchaeota archaeon]